MDFRGNVDKHRLKNLHFYARLAFDFFNSVSHKERISNFSKNLCKLTAHAIKTFLITELKRARRQRAEYHSRAKLQQRSIT